MEDGLLSLKWNNHKTTFFEILRILRDKASYTDATLAVDGKFYPVHKLVLSTCSEYFSEIFERTPCKSPVIVLKDVRCEDLESLLDYMYIGEVNVNQNDLALLLKTAECLRIKGLAVPDDDPTRHSSASSKVHMLNKDDVTKDTPPSKRRRQDSTSAPALSPPRISPAALIPVSPSHTSSSSHPHKTAAESCSPRRDSQQHDTPLVKVEMEDTEGEENFPSDNCDGSVDPEKQDYIEKSEHDPSGYPNANFSAQNTGDMQWEDGENSFPPESFGGDTSSQHAAGGLQLLSLLDFSCDDETESFGISDMRSISPTTLLQPYVPPDTPTAAGTGSLQTHSKSNIRYNCAYCVKAFRSKVDLERHLRTHTGEKPFVCVYCPHRSATKGNLKAHIRNIHPEESLKQLRPNNADKDSEHIS